MVFISLRVREKPRAFFKFCKKINANFPLRKGETFSVSHVTHSPTIKKCVCHVSIAFFPPMYFSLVTTSSSRFEVVTSGGEASAEVVTS